MQPLATLEDRVLIERTLAGQGECFGVLMDRHMAALKKCINSMVRNASNADDMLQDAVVKVWRHLATFRSESGFRTWMTRVAINEVLQSYRREKCRPRPDPGNSLDTLVSSFESPHLSLVRSQATQTVHCAVAGLPEKYRQVLILRDLEEFTTRETAQRLDATIPAVKSRLFRARFMLSTALRHSGIQSRPI
jgi:RNA polymerase sigma-70 factor (ECF subfamily)